MQVSLGGAFEMSREGAGKESEASELGLLRFTPMSPGALRRPSWSEHERSNRERPAGLHLEWCTEES